MRKLHRVMGVLLILGGMTVALLGVIAQSAVARVVPRVRASDFQSTHRPSRRQGLHEHRVPPPAAAAIVGGSNAAQGTWRYVAFVAHFDAAGNPDFFCSGTVISSNVVLTAGHCAVDEATGSVLDPSGFVVVTGSVDWTDSTQRQVSDVSDLVVYPSYDPATGHGDAALLILSSPTTAPVVRLATTADQNLVQAGTGAFIVGWGDTYVGSPAQFLLQWASIGVQSPAYCGQYEAVFDGSQELCTVGPPNFATGTCFGDSGGPLVAADSNNQPVQIGITSRGPTDCNTATADFFTRADSISGWATSWMAAVAPPTPAPPTPAPPTPTPSTPTPPTPSRPSPAPPSRRSSAPKLPTMTSSVARGLVHTTLAGVYGRNFKHGHQYTARCSRQSAVRFSCHVTFTSGPNYYSGNVTVYYLRGSGSKVYWNDKYAMKWVNDRCYFRSGHRRRCAVHSHRGVF